jgi:putative beta-lysine N-acetyltransferase
MIDQIEKIGNSLIQHGKHNDRIYLMKYASEDIEDIFIKFDILIQKNKYSKIFAKVSFEHEHLFKLNGFVREAVIPNYYKTDACSFMGKYLSFERKSILDDDRVIIKDVLKCAKSKSNQFGGPKLNEEDELRTLSESDAKELSLLYKKVFESYPFPIFNSDYILKTMREHVLYFGIYNKDKLIAASSAEFDLDTKSVEMTDFATLPDYRGRKLALGLLASMELEMHKRNIQICYTIARSLSYGMNISFSKAGYHYGGTLANNTNISGRIESMNVWYKLLSE